MKGLLSLDQELRATRRAKAQKNARRSGQTPALKENERPWQSDIDMVQETMRELLRAVAGLSGVELPGLPPGLQDDDAPPPRLDIKTLKDRFRNDLEGFSIKVTEELAKRAKEQTQAAFVGVQDEMRGSIDQVAAEFREQLQLPAHVEKLVEPCVEKAAARLEKSLSQRVEQLVSEHGKLVQDRLLGVESSFQTQVSTLEHTVQQIRDLKSVSDSHLSGERTSTTELAGRIDQIAAEFREKLQGHEQIEKLVEPSVVDAEARLEKALCQKVEHLVAEHEKLVQERLQGTLTSVQAQISTLENSVQHVRELKTVSAPQFSAERSSAADVAGRIDQVEAELREKFQNHVQIEQLVEPSVEGAAARLEKSLGQKVENLVAQHEQLVRDSLQGTLSSVQAQLSKLEKTVQHIRDHKSEPVAQLPAEQPIAAADSTTKEPATSSDNGFNGFLDQAFSRIESSFSSLRQSASMQNAPGSVSGLGDRSSAIPFSNMDRERRVQEALDELGRLGTKNPHPVS